MQYLTEYHAAPVATSPKVSKSRCTRWLSQSLALSGVIVGSLAFSGCQSTRMAGFDLPVPQRQLDASPLDTVRYQNHETYRAPQTPVSQTPVSQTPAAKHQAVRFQSPDASNNQALNKASDDRGELWNPRTLDRQLKNLGRSNPALEPQENEVSNRSQIVSDLIITGNSRLPTHHLTRSIHTRAGRYFDPDKLQQDVDSLWRMPEISRINGPYLKQSPDGIVITIDVVERIVISEINFLGNRGITDRNLKKEIALTEGDPLDVHQIRMAKTKLEELYKRKGYSRTQVDILEGNEANDTKVVFLIHEDQQQRVWKVEFEGNQIATDARLRSFIESKPGYLKMIGGLVKRDEIEQDILRLTNYYRSLGFFNARIGREISESNDGRWMTIRFIINEGPRYRVRSVSFLGNRIYGSEQLEKLVELKPSELVEGISDAQPEFNVAKMNQDVVALQDLYGGQGYVFANVEAEPRFLEEPGLLDIVYKIEEGKQYRVGNINVHFDGDYGITRREVVLNRLTCRPGELIDVREIRRSERLLGAAQVFAAPGTPGAQGPKIVVRPPELKALERHAGAESNYR